MNRFVEQLRSTVLKMRREQPLIQTMWPGDYRRGSVYTMKGQPYYITRYVRNADQQAVEVWGRPLSTAPNSMQHEVGQPSTLTPTASLDYR